MRFVQFYGRSAVNPAEVIEACGDRAVIVLDARESFSRQLDYCESQCRLRGYVGFSVHAGESFSRSRIVLPYRSIHYRYTLHRADGEQIGQAQTAQGIADRAQNGEFSHDTTEPAFPFVAFRFDPMGLIGDSFKTSIEAMAECRRVLQS